MMFKSYFEEHGISPYEEIPKGHKDFRDVLCRKYLFFSLYEFHCKYKINPGLVYLYLPVLTKDMDIEDKLWVALLEGITENPCSVFAIIKYIPHLPRNEKDIDEFIKFFENNYRRIDYDNDTVYQKNSRVLRKALNSYIDILDGKTQENFFLSLNKGDDEKWFDELFNCFIQNLYSMNRMSVWSYLEFVKIVSGFTFKYSSFFMGKRDESLSQRNGLLYYLGRDDLIAKRGESNKHSNELMDWCEIKAKELTEELKIKFKGYDFIDDVGYQTVESVLCCYKNLFHGRRYPNIYTDMSYLRIKKAEQNWKELDYSIFWKIRKDNLPKELLVECTSDLGLCKAKQNHFKETGEVPMLSVMDKVYACSWDKYIYSKESQLF